MNKKILVITSGYFPEGEPGALRIRMFCRTLAYQGNDITVLCRGEAEEVGVIDGTIAYYSLRGKIRKKIDKLIDYVSFLKKIKKHPTIKDIDAIYIYNAPIAVFLWAKKYAKVHSIVLVHDCVEWYSPSEFKFGIFNPAYIAKSIINRVIIDKNFKVIAISRYLEKYFCKKGIDTINIPMLCDCRDYSEKQHTMENSLTLFYAGTPAKKDLVGNVILALRELHVKKNIRFVIFGCTPEHLCKYCNVNDKILEDLKEIIEIKGRVPRKQIIEAMKEADFLILPRDAELRYAKAGFPSKVVEALANGIPIICNYHSDLAEYLIDGKNAIISNGHTVESLKIAIENAVSLTSDEKIALKRNARKTAKEKIDIYNYGEIINSFIFGK